MSGEVTVQGISMDIADGPCGVCGQGEVHPVGLVCGLYAPKARYLGQSAPAMLLCGE